jgi:hypothetical protein
MGRDVDPEHWLAAKRGRRLERLREQRPELRLGSDGKVLVVCDVEKRRLNMFSTSLHNLLVVTRSRSIVLFARK